MPKIPHSSTAQTAHSMLIAELKRYPEVQTHGFWAAMRVLPDAEYVPDMLTHDPEYLEQHKFIPDAWAVDAEAREVTVFEVVCTHDVPAAKIANIVNFAWALFEDNYTFGMVRCDLSGRRVYDCLTMGIVAEFDRPEHDDAQAYAFWQRYTSEVCERRIALARPDILAEIERLSNG